MFLSGNFLSKNMKELRKPPHRFLPLKYLKDLEY